LVGAGVVACAFALAKLNIVFFPANRTERDPDRSPPVFIPKREILESLRFEIRAVAAQERLALIAPVGFHLSVSRAFIHNIGWFQLQGYPTIIGAKVNVFLHKSENTLTPSLSITYEQ
jgi:hypothetical protein